MNGPDNPRTPLSHLPVQGRTTPMERPRHQVGDGGRPWAYCDPRLAQTQFPSRTRLGAIIYAPATIAELRTMLERIGFLRVAPDDDIVAPPADDADEIRRDHIADGATGWARESSIMEPLLCEFLWHSMWSWIARRPGKAVRVDMVAILVDLPHEVTGRVQVSARMRISTAKDAAPKLKGPDDETIRRRVRALTGGPIDE